MAALPKTMLAVTIDGKGGPEVLKPIDAAVPLPAPGQILVKVAAAGVNRPDVQQRMGAYPPPTGHSPLPGLEIAGEVAAVGPAVTRWNVGDRVCALVNGGGYAAYCLAEDVQTLPVPAGLAMTEAAGLPETVFTVWNNVFERGRLGPGEWLLVHGGTSGIGTMAIALGTIFNLTVIVTAGSDEKCAAALALGAAHAINYRTDDFVARVRDITGGRGVQAVLDMVGGDYVPRNLQCLADDGRHVSIAVQGGLMATIPIFEVMRRRLTLTGSTLRPRDTSFKSMVADELARIVWPHVSAGRLKPVIDTTFPLAQAGAAHARMEGGDHVGKIVLTLD